MKEIMLVFPPKESEPGVIPIDGPQVALEKGLMLLKEKFRDLELIRTFPEAGTAILLVADEMVSEIRDFFESSGSGLMKLLDPKDRRYRAAVRGR